MLLAIDIEHHIALGLIENKKVLKISRVETHLPRIFKKKLRTICASFARQCPQLGNCHLQCRAASAGDGAKVCRKDIFHKTFRDRQDRLVPITNCYRKPKQVRSGSSRMRLCCNDSLRCTNGHYRFWDRRLLFDVVSRKRNIWVGLLFRYPFVGRVFVCLKTLLPKFASKDRKSLIGRDTQGSILSGCFMGMEL